LRIAGPGQSPNEAEKAAADAAELVNQLKAAKLEHDLVTQLLGCRLLACTRHGVLQHYPHVVLVAASRAVLHVFADIGSVLRAQFVVEVVLQSLLRLFAAAVGHDALAFGVVFNPSSWAYSASASRSWRRPRWSRLITVPEGVSMMSAIS
jgi:hypothetical protein